MLENKNWNLKIAIFGLFTFSINETEMLEKHGNVGTKGLKTTLVAADI